MQINLIPIKTRIVNPPKDEIWDIIDSLEIEDGDIVFITSKILGIHQGRCIPIGSVEKEELIRQESTHHLKYRNYNGWCGNLTITDNILIPAAGIDESNADGHYIMWPKEVDKLCAEIRSRIMKRTGVMRLGIVSTDSHTQPLRTGVTGITTGFSGIKPLRDIRGDKDIFGREIAITQVNVIDPLTGMVVLIMGEASEQTPVVVLRGLNGIEFDANYSMNDLNVAIDIDIYQPLLDVMRKK